MRRHHWIIIAVIATTGAPPIQSSLLAQDTLRLERLQAAALRRDPRGRQFDLLQAQAARRIENIATERLPQLSLTGEATHQSDVTTVRIATPSGSPPQPPKDRWQTVVNVQQMVYDGGSVSERRAVERARLAESHETLRATQYRLRTEVDASFFNAFLLQERERELAALVDDLGTGLDVLRARVREGAALPGEAAAVEAERLRAQQSAAEVRAGRRAALGVIGALTGAEVTERDVLALPDLEDAVAHARRAGDTAFVRARPEFTQFSRARERIGREAALAGVERRPRVYAFGQAGYGRPGLDQFNTTPDEFWVAGVRLEWRFWNWGTVSRQQEVLRLQQRIVETEEGAFADALVRAVQGDLEHMARLDTALAADERIIGLREQVERQARVQLDEGVITAAEYVVARTALLDARLRRQRHHIELAQARARYLTTVGVTTGAAEPRQ